MPGWLERKSRDLRHALQELRTGDSIDARRNGVRTLDTGGALPGGPVLLQLPMGLERVLRRAAVDEGFCQQLVADRAAALDGCGLDLTASERAVLLATPEEHLLAMTSQLAPANPVRRSFIKRLAAAVALAVFGIAAAGSQMGCPLTQTKGIRPDTRAPKTTGCSARPPAGGPKVRTGR